MISRNGVIAGLFFLTTCSLRDQDSATVEQTAKALGSMPPTEVAVWRKVAWTNLPDRRYLQAVAFDWRRRVLVMFGGIAIHDDTGKIASSGDQDGVVAATDATTVSVTVPSSKISAGAIFEAKLLQGRACYLGR